MGANIQIFNPTAAAPTPGLSKIKKIVYSGMKRTSLWGLISGPLLMAALMAYPGDLVSPAADPVLALGLWMIVWWISEAVSISVTALLPLLVMPLLGILPLDEVGGYYGSPDHIFVFWWFCDGPRPGESWFAQTHCAEHYPENRHLPCSCTLGIHDRDGVLEHVDQQYSHGCIDAADCSIRDSFVDRGQ